jgi:hypothetical protein
MRSELQIVVAVLLFGVTASSVHEIMFGAGLPGLPTTILAATLGGLFWGLAVVGIRRAWRFFKAPNRKSM